MATLQGLTAMCTVHAPDFGDDEAAAGLSMASELHTIFLHMKNGGACGAAQVLASTQAAPASVAVAVTEAAHPIRETPTVSHVLATAVGTAGDRNAAKKPKKRVQLEVLVAGPPATASLFIPPPSAVPCCAQQTDLINQLTSASRAIQGANELVASCDMRDPKWPLESPVTIAIAQATIYLSAAFIRTQDTIHATLTEAMPCTDSIAAAPNAMSLMKTVTAVAMGRSTIEEAGIAITIAPIKFGNKLFRCPYADTVTGCCTLMPRSFQANKKTSVVRHMTTKAHIRAAAKMARGPGADSDSSGESGGESGGESDMDGVCK